MYYSEENIIELLHDGVYNKILGEEIKDKLFRNSNICLLKSELESNIKNELDQTLFIPLLDGDKPNESGNTMIRYLVHKLNIKSVNTDFHFNVSEEKIQKHKRIIIVDDCIGSGDQLNKFWNINMHVQKIKNYASQYSIPIYYLVLIGYEKQILDLQIHEELLGLRIVICDKLQECNRIFSAENNIWSDNEELDFSINYFNCIEKSIGINRLGYKNLDFAVFIHNIVPDWSLPIFWQQNSDWKALLKRKNSNS